MTAAPKQQRSRRKFPPPRAGEESQTVSAPFPHRFSFRAWCSFRFIDQNQHVTGGGLVSMTGGNHLPHLPWPVFSKSENHPEPDPPVPDWKRTDFASRASSAEARPEGKPK